jgi:superfamily I DNA and/or RNA helicase
LLVEPLAQLPGSVTFAAMEYFKKLQELLKIEQEEDKRLYQQQAETLSVTERRAYGLTWYPIAIRDTEMTRGDYLSVEVERTTHQDVVHQLRFGASAALFSNHDPKADRVEGVVTFQGGNKLKITLRTDELPDWARDGKLGIDLLFDDNSYDEMQQALKLAIVRSEKKEEGRLIQVLSGNAAPTFETEHFPYTISRLNASQQAAVHKILSANDLAIVHGPPGTGKTTTLVQAIKALIKQEPQQILVVAPSNAAVDLLSEKLSDEGLSVLRVGNPARVSEKLTSFTLDSKVSEHPSMKEVKRLKKQASSYKDMAHKYKRNFGKAEREQRKALFDEAHKIMKEVENTEQYIVNDLLTRAQVITATLVGANHYTVRHLKYRTVVIDEAGQALEPACWIPILKGRKVVLAGDHCQLPPTIKSQEAAQKGLATTLLEKCVQLYPEAVVLLEEQYRMHEMIMGYSSGVFYGNRLKAHESVAGHLLFDADRPLSFIDTAGCGYDEKQDGTSTTNPEEAAFLFRHLTQLVADLSTRYQPGNFPTIAVISPYKQQVELLKEQLQHSPALKEYNGNITVNTIDSFQGQERDIVYIGMTRSNSDNKIGFLSDIRRMNVAMTRARKKLVVIGDSATLSQLPFYSDFISYAEQRNAWQSAWEFVEE